MSDSKPRGTTRLPYMPGVDALRALAVLAVFFYHAALSQSDASKWLPGGFLGVDLFFVISGYLITSLLLNEYRKAGRINLGRFWLRRARRLLPAVGVLIAVVLVLAALIEPEQIASLRLDALSSLTYVTNWRLIETHQSYFEAFARPSVFRHLWSLAVEEQFYLLWPIACGAGMTFLGRKRLMLSVVGGVLVSALLMALLFDPHDPNRDFYGTDTRAMALLGGVLLAFAWNPNSLKQRTGRYAPLLLDAVGLFALFMVLYSFFNVHDFDQSLYHGGFLMFAIWGTLLVGVLAHPASHLSRLFANPPMLWLGLRSYSFYLWHWPILMFTRPDQDVPFGGPILVILQLALTLGVADLSYRYVEQPFRRPGGQLRPDWLRLGRVGLAAGVLLIVFVIGWSGLVSSKGVRPPQALAAHVTAKNHKKGGVSIREQAQSSEVLALGDSVMVGAKPGLEARLGNDLTLDAAVGRQASDMVAVIHGYKASGQLPPRVVLQLGNNGPLYSEDMEPLRKELEDVEHVYLINDRVPREWEQESNDALAEAARTWGNAELIDWHDVAARNGNLTFDGIHLTPQGDHVYSQLIYDAVNKDAPPPPPGLLSKPST